MKAKAVKRVRLPQYPTRLELLANPTLLQKHMPAAWRSCAGMAGALAVFLAANTYWAQAQEPVQGKVAVVAPIFKHGEGRGAVGCVVVNPPVFLSEEDAMQVIGEELRNSGITLARDDRLGNIRWILTDVSMPARQERWSSSDERFDIINTGVLQPLVLQGVNGAKRVAVEMVGHDNYFELGGAASSSTVQGYDFPKVAQEVRGSILADFGKAPYLPNLKYFGIFYDPVTNRGFGSQSAESDKRLRELYGEYYKLTDPAAKQAKQKEIHEFQEGQLVPFKEESRRLLRMQVRDFVDWLKGQGVI